MRDKSTTHPSPATHTLSCETRALRRKPVFELSKLTFLVLAAFSFHHANTHAQTLDIGGTDYEVIQEGENVSYTGGTIADGGWLDNEGTLTNNGTLTDSGNLNNYAGATLHNNGT